MREGMRPRLTVAMSAGECELRWGKSCGALAKQLLKCASGASARLAAGEFEAALECAACEGAGATDCRLPRAECRLPICRVPSADCRLLIAECRLPIADGRVQIADCRWPIADHRVPSVECRLSIAGCRVPSADGRLLMADDRLQITDRRVLMADCRSPSAECRIAEMLLCWRCEATATCWR